MAEENQDYYELLGVAHNSTIDEIRAQRNRLLQAYHPDHNKSPSANDMTKRINLAWETLSDPAKRHEYDETNLAEKKSSAIRHRAPSTVHRRTRSRQPSRRVPHHADLDEEEYDPSVFCFPISDENDVTARAISYVLPRLTSHPNSSNKLLKLEDSQLVLHPVYRIQYNVHQNFTTSVGLIHSVDVDYGELLLDGNTGNLLNQQIDEFLKGTPISRFRREKVDSVRVARRPFQLEQTTVVQKAKQIIANQHAKRVSYYGANNVHYTKTCIPAERNIVIRECDKVLTPEWSISLSALAKTYRFNALENPKQLLFLENELSICKICNKLISETQEMLLCNSCGNIVHKGKSHGYICRICNKSICRNCTHWMRRRKFFKSYLCKECAMGKQKLQKITRQLVPDQPKRFCNNCGAKMPTDALQCVKCQSPTSSRQSRSNKVSVNPSGLKQRENSRQLERGRGWETVKKILKVAAIIIFGIVLQLLMGKKKIKIRF